MTRRRDRVPFHDSLNGLFYGRLYTACLGRHAAHIADRVRSCKRLVDQFTDFRELKAHQQLWVPVHFPRKRETLRSGYAV